MVKRYSFMVNLLKTGLPLLGAVSLSVSAQEPQPSQTVEVVGSRIKQIAGETGLPVTVLQAQDLRREGVTTAEEAVDRITADQSVVSSNGVVGNAQAGRSEASLRGLGGNKTLVLVNGRRLANHPYSSGATDLNAIPLAAVERIEVLRDGASAIYGTDAIGGVINFITRQDFQGTDVSAGYSSPQHSGGRERDVTFTGGSGNLATDGYNFLGVIDYQRQDPLHAVDRDFAANGINLDHGVVKSSGMTFPGNVFQSATRVSANPYFPTCRPPNSFSLASLYGQNCRTDYARASELIPETERTNLLGHAGFALSGGHTATVEYMRSLNQMTMIVAAEPLFNLTMTPANPYYPGKGITPAIPGLNTSQNISISWRTDPLGPRVDKFDTVSQRLVGQLEGKIGAWDYNTGLFWSLNNVTDDFASGYIGATPVSQALRNGNPLFINPFSDPTPAEQAFLNQSQVIGKAIDASGKMVGIDAHASRKLGGTAAGPISLAVGAEARNEKYNQTFNPPLANDIFGLPPDVDLSVAGKREVSAVFGEAIVPITKTLEAQLALRHDRYSDFGGTTNPKVALRWQPAKSFLLRASANHGFRAPTLYEINQPERVSASPGMFNDPVLCPNGVPVPGANAGRDCHQQMNVRSAGNANLEPERSSTWSLGMVVEPSPALSMSLDYWNILLKDQIGALTPQAIFADPTKYADKFVRCGELPADRAAAIQSCRTQSGAIDPRALAYVNAANENLGNLKTDGLDLGLKYRFPQTRYGRVMVGYEGTYVHSYERQHEKDGPYAENVGSIVDTMPVFRWQHELSVRWAYGNWTTDVLNHFKSGYEDQNDPTALISPSFHNHVNHYSLWDMAVTWKGKDHLNVTGGIQNLFDTDPPFSNQNFLTQANYDPRVTDPRGRTFFVRANYSF